MNLQLLILGILVLSAAASLLATVIGCYVGRVMARRTKKNTAFWPLRTPFPALPPVSPDKIAPTPPRSSAKAG